MQLSGDSEQRKERVERRASRRRRANVCTEGSNLRARTQFDMLSTASLYPLQHLARIRRPPSNLAARPPSSLPSATSLVLVAFRTSRLVAAAQRDLLSHLSAHHSPHSHFNSRPQQLEARPSTARSMFAALLNWLRSLLWNKQADIALIGLQNSGKVCAFSCPLSRC